MPGALSFTSLFSARNCCAFLAALFEAEKAGGKNSSLRTFSAQIGIGLSTLKMVLDGSRKLTIKNIHVIARSLNLSKAEREYFESMVLRDQADDRDVREYYQEKMRGILTEKKAQHVRISNAKVMQDWYVPAFLIYLLDVEGIATKGVTDSCFERASTALGISPADLKKAFNDLKETGIIKATSDSRYHIVFERVNASLVKQRYIKQVAGECHRRIGRDFENPRAMFTAHTLSMPQEMVRAFYDEYKQLVEKYMTFQADDPNRLEILQVCCQSIPLITRRRLDTINAH